MKKEISVKWLIILILVEIIVFCSLGYWHFKNQSKVVLESNLVDKGYVEKNDNDISEPRNLVALGNSLTMAAGLSSEKIGDNPEYSFTTGTEIDSFYLKLKNKGENLIPVNLAISGSKSKDVLEKQIPTAITLNPKYVTILIGGNDLLSGVSVEDFTNNLVQIVTKFDTSKTKVLIAANPNIEEIGKASYPSCQKESLTPELEALARKIVSDYNQAIQGVANQYELTFVDLYSVLGPEDVSSYDCRHLSLGGQKKLAEAFFDALGLE